MKQLLISMTLLIFSSLRSTLANEPPEAVNLTDKVRMSTLIVVGKAIKSCVFDTRSLTVVKDKHEIGPHEKASVQIQIARVLYSSENEAPVYSVTTHPGTVDVVFGSPGLDIGGPETTLKIFFLTSDADRTDATRPYRYPFWSAPEP